MKTLTRYLIRAHVGPFAFAFAAITSLLFLTAIAQRFQELSGKGVGPAVIVELMLLSLPHVVTLAVPMALFAATLYVFADLSVSNELVALAAGGVHPARLIAPLIVAGLALSLVMVRFNDRALPWANARFQDLLQDVSRKSPTLRLQPGAMTALHAKDGAPRFAMVRSIDGSTNTLRGVTIVDLSQPDRPEYVTAERASVAVLPNGRDLVLRLTNGQLSRPFLDRPGNFQWAHFQSFLMDLRGLAAKVQRGERVGDRAERELSFGALHERIREAQNPVGDAVSAADAQARHVVVVRSLGELNRRYATAFACLVFVLLAAPLGIRFAHAGIGAVVALSVAVLFFFRVGIIWGDRLTDAGRINPIVGNWASIGVLLLIALLLLMRFGGTASHSPTASGTA